MEYFPKYWQNLIAAAAIYLVSVTPVVGDLIGFLMIPFIAPLFLTVAMLQMLMLGITRAANMAILIVPVCYFGFGVFLAMNDSDEVRVIREEASALAASQPKFAPPSHLGSVTIGDCPVLNHLTLGELLGVSVNRTKPQRKRNSTAAHANSPTQAQDFWGSDDAEQDLPMAEDWASSNDAESATAPQTTDWGTMARQGEGGVRINCEIWKEDSSGKGESYLYTIAFNGQRTHFISGYRKVASGIMLPIVMRGPVYGGGYSQLDAQFSFDSTVSTDPDKLSPAERIARILRSPG